MKHVVRIAQNFLKSEDDVTVESYGNGIIHDTYLASPAKGQKFILQKLNLHVFKEPELVMQNIRIVCDHVHDRLGQEPGTQFAKWQMLNIIPTIDGRDFFVDEQGSFWRGLTFVHDATVLEKVGNREEARQIGIALGRFHFLVNDLDFGRLHDTLPGFHNMVHYLTRFGEVIEKSNIQDYTERMQYCLDCIEKGIEWALLLENATALGKLTHRITHGDPKSNNVMLDIDSHKAVSMIDLDTVRPGLILYDIADCLRSCCNSFDESARDLATVAFDSSLCRAVLSGYLTEYPFLTDADYEYLYDAMRIIAFELGLRFVTDFLESDIYFKTDYKGHNLDRAMVQFKLAVSIESQEALLRDLINDCRIDCSKGHEIYE